MQNMKKLAWKPFYSWWPTTPVIATMWPNIWKATIPIWKMRCWLFIQRKMARFLNQPQAKPKKNWINYGRRPTKLIALTAPIKPSSPLWFSKRAGTCVTLPPSWACVPIQLKVISCPNRRWDVACAKCTPAAWRNTSVLSVLMPLWTSWNPFRPKAWCWNANQWAKARSPRHLWWLRSMKKMPRKTSMRWILKSRCWHPVFTGNTRTWVI